MGIAYGLDEPRGLRRLRLLEELGLESETPTTVKELARQVAVSFDATATGAGGRYRLQGGPFLGKQGGKEIGIVATRDGFAVSVAEHGMEGEQTGTFRADPDVLANVVRWLRTHGVH